VSPYRDSSRSLLPTREVRADAALGGRAADAARRLRPSALAARAGAARFPLAAPTWPGSVPRPAPEPELGVAYDTAWSRRYPVRLARAVVLDNVTRPLARLVAQPQMRGEDALVGVEGPVIFAANHASHIDTPLLLACLPQQFRHRTVVAAAADYFFDRRWKADLSTFLLGAIPMERTKVNRRSAQAAAELIGDGWNLVIFPEGGRSPDGWGQPFRGGAAYLSIRTGRPVIPVHLDGTRHVLAKGSRTVRRSRTTVTYGLPLWPAEGEDARAMAARIEAAVAALADEQSTDWWQARKAAAQGSSAALAGPDVAPWRRSWALPPAPDRREDIGGPEQNTWPRRSERS